jgi:HEAT repeat protein
MLESQEIEKRRAAVDHLAGLEMRIAAPYLLERLRDSEPGVRARAARALGPGAVMEAATPLLACMNDVEAQVRAACVEAFGQYGAVPSELQKRAAMTLSRVMADGQYDVRLEVLRAVERLLRSEVLTVDEQPHLLGPVLLRVEDEHVVVRRAAASLLGYFTATAGDVRKRIAVALLGRLSDAARDVRLEALSSLTRLAEPAAAPAALRLLSDSAEDVRRQAVLYLGQVGYAPAAPLFADLLQRAPEPLRQAAAQALSNLVLRLAASGAFASPSANPKPGPGTAASPAANVVIRDAIAALVGGLDRDEIRPAVRPAVLALGALAVPALLAQLSADRPGLRQVPPVVDTLRDLAPTLTGEGRGQAAAALLAELGRGRLPRERVIDALAALAEPSLLPTFISLAGDSDENVRLHALGGLGKLPRLDERALDTLLAVSRDGDAALRQRAATLLPRVLAGPAIARLCDLLRDSSLEVRVAAAKALAVAAKQAAGAGRATIFDGRSTAALVSVIGVSGDGLADVRFRRAAGSALGQIAALGPQLRAQVVNEIATALRGLRASPAAQELVTALGAALRGAGQAPGPEVAPARSLLLDLATVSAGSETEAGLVALDALDALAALRDPAVTSRVSRLLSHSDPVRRVRAAATLGSLASSGASDGSSSALIAVLQSDRSVAVVAEAAWALGKIPLDKAGPAVAALRRTLGQREGMGGERAVRVNALAALARLGRAEPGDAVWLSEGEPLSRANAALLLTALPQKTPGLLARLRNVEKTDADHRARRAATQALRGQGPATAGERTQFLGLFQLDIDQQPLSESPFRLTQPDGLSRIGITDRRGIAREEQVPPGSCEVELLFE